MTLRAADRPLARPEPGQGLSMALVLLLGVVRPHPVRATAA
jgi:hypothetical protein